MRPTIHHRDDETMTEQVLPATEQTSPLPSCPSWRLALPDLCGERVVVRNIRGADAAPLCTVLTTPDVQRFISPPPSTIEGFERFIARSRQLQHAGQLACFAVTLKGSDTPIGLIQIRETEREFATAEWGFAIGADYWGLGLFQEAAHLVLAFAFEQLRAHRIEARAAVKNGRGSRALLKVGAVHEGVLRRSFLRDGEYLDQSLYAIVEDDWRAARSAHESRGSDLVH